MKNTEKQISLFDRDQTLTLPSLTVGDFVLFIMVACAVALVAELAMAFAPQNV